MVWYLPVPYQSLNSLSSFIFNFKERGGIITYLGKGSIMFGGGIAAVLGRGQRLVHSTEAVCFN